MRGRVLARSLLLLVFLFVPAFVSAAPVTLYLQSDDSGEMVSQQPNFMTASIESTSLGNVHLGQGPLTLTFTLQDPNASNAYGQPSGVALESCLGCRDLQTYYFTAADRTLLADGVPHTFTVETGATTREEGDGTNPIYIQFFGLSQYQFSTHVKSNAAGTIPALTITSPTPPPSVGSTVPEGATLMFVQSDRSGVMVNPQPNFANSYIDSASLGNLALGQGKLVAVFTLKDPNANNIFHTPTGLCLQPANTSGCNSALQVYRFTDADRTLLADGGYHTFTVEMASTSAMYADGTQPVSLGFYGLSQIHNGTEVKSNASATIPFVSIYTLAPPAPPADPCVATQTCASNVLFLPGIEGSRLYESDGNGGDKKLWEPSLHDHLQDLYLDRAGKSLHEVYAKAGDVIDETPVTGANIYKSFMEKMDSLVSSGTINAWEAAPYDWRLSIDDILNSGKQTGSHISYTTATSTPYIVQELKRLAASSKSGKVTIIAHSNGGLVAKALTNLLGSSTSKSLIDKMIFVAVPQAGTPAGLAADLHGIGQAFGGGLYVSQASARTFASTSPMAYHLLPSASYFTQVDNPVVYFDGSLPDWVARYGVAIHSAEGLHTFITDTFGKVDAQAGNVNQPIQMSASLLAQAEALHASLDNWAPPAGIPLTQIAGWGVPTTISGLNYRRDKNNLPSAEPVFTIDGDGTVVAPSALWTSASVATNYWMNLRSYNSDHPIDAGFGFATFDHSRILEPVQLLDFLSDQISSTTKPLTSYTYLSTQAPADSEKRLRYALHSPLTLDLYDAQGRHTGVSTSTGQVEEQIPGTYYTEFGDVKYLFTSADTPARVVMEGFATGTFTFNVDQYSGDTVTASTTFKDIPTTPSTSVALSTESDISTLSPMLIDKNGDGVVDATLSPKLGGTVTLDTTPPELRVTFSTSTTALAFTATDDSGVATLSSSTVYPPLKKNQKDYKGTATVTVTARDASSNTTSLVYTEQLPSPDKRDTITLVALASGGATTTLANATVSYKWRVNGNGTYKLFATHLRTATTRVESHYRPKKDKTVIMTTPQDLDDTDTDDDADVRPTKQVVAGLVVPYITTKKGSLIISY